MFVLFEYLTCLFLYHGASLTRAGLNFPDGLAVDPVFTASWLPASSRSLATDTDIRRYQSTLDIFPMKIAPPFFVNSTECNISSLSSDAGEVVDRKLAVAHLVGQLARS